MAVAPFGSLLSRSWRFYSSHIVAILVGVVAASIVTLLLQMAFAASLPSSGRFKQMGVDLERVQELQQRVASGDQAAADQLDREMKSQIERMSSGMIFAFAKQLGPIFLVFLIIQMIVMTAVSVYYILLVLEDRSITGAATGMLGYVFPMIGLALWTFLRSFAWIPILGIIPAIILGPRFLPSGVILIQERKGILESAQQSYERTSGSWGKIVGNIIVVASIVWVLLFISGLVLNMLFPGLQSPSLLNAFLFTLVTQLVGAFLLIFMVYLSLAVLDDTKKAA